MSCHLQVRNISYSVQLKCQNIYHLMSSYEFRVPEAHRRFVTSKLEFNSRVGFIHVSGLYLKEASFHKMNFGKIKLLIC